MKKRVWSLLLAMVLLCGVLPHTEIGKVFATSVENDASEFRYTIADGEVTITSFVGESTSIVVPSTIEGYPVTCIGDKAFSGHETLISVTIPEGVTSINLAAFAFCSSLQSVILPSSLTRIETDAFLECTSLTSITIPKNVIYIGERAFSYCKSLFMIDCEADKKPDNWSSAWLQNCDASVSWGSCSHVDTPKSEFILAPTCTQDGKRYLQCDACGNVCSVLELFPATGHTRGEDSLCMVCGSNLDYSYSIHGDEVAIWNYIGNDVNVVIPDMINGYPVRRIEEKAFSGHETLISVTIPEGVTYIGNYAFASCVSLQSITLPDSLEIIGEYAFQDCYSLTSIAIPKNVTFVGNHAFNNCKSLSVIDCQANTQPDSWNKLWLEGCAANVHWGGCTHVDTPKTEFILAPTCTQDGKRYLQCDACGNVCSVLELFPATGHTRGEDSLCMVCGSNLDYSYSIHGDEVAIWNYIGNDVNVVIPDMINGYPVRRIEEKAFSGHETLISVTIPKGVKYIGNYAFASCVSLQSVTLPDSLEMIAEYTFQDCYSLTSITIPKNVTFVGSHAFNNCKSLSVIDCQANTQPDSWNKLWLEGCTANVHWGAQAETTLRRGDVNSDGDVDGKDVTRLMSYLANYDFDNNTCDIEISNGADCNADGVVDGKDVVRLLRYLSELPPMRG